MEVDNNSRGTVHFYSFQASFFLRNLQKPRRNSDRFLKRTMVEKNGESTPRTMAKIASEARQMPRLLMPMPFRPQSRSWKGTRPFEPCRRDHFPAPPTKTGYPKGKPKENPCHGLPKQSKTLATEHRNQKTTRTSLYRKESKCFEAFRAKPLEKTPPAPPPEPAPRRGP